LFVLGSGKTASAEAILGANCVRNAVSEQTRDNNGSACLPHTFVIGKEKQLFLAIGPLMCHQIDSGEILNGGKTKGIIEIIVRSEIRLRKYSNALP